MPDAPTPLDRRTSVTVVAAHPTDPWLADLYAVVRDVYATSDQMCEVFAERYPAVESLVADVAAVGHRPGGLFLVALTQGRPCGYLVIRPRHEARLRHTADLQMGVAHRHRGLGIGRRLLVEALARLARERAIEIVYLMVRADNRAALGLYADAGFDQLATLERDTRIDGRAYDGVLMRRFVDAPTPQPIR